MKKMLSLAFILSIFLISCQEKPKSEIKEKQEQTAENLISDSVNILIDKSLMACLDSEPKSTEELSGEEGGLKEWRYCKQDNIEVLSITLYEEEVKSSEAFILIDNQLVQATEEVTIGYASNDGGTKWNCVYQVKNGSVEDYISLGHGKTEMDDFNASEILDIFEKRIVEFEGWR
jgi:hypothetical protein